jgi:hypothetical protein
MVAAVQVAGEPVLWFDFAGCVSDALASPDCDAVA